MQLVVEHLDDQWTGGAVGPYPTGSHYCLLLKGVFQLTIFMLLLVAMHLQ